MPKRTNEDAASSQPAAKRSANATAAEPQEELLLRAQASLDRLDFKTTEQICTEIIDSGKVDLVQPLMMRSISLGRRGQYSESVQDAEKALKSKKSLETHLRAAFSYLGLVQHHLDLAKEFSIQANETQNDPETGAATQSLLSTNVIELEKSIQEAKSLEKRGSFKRVSPELFTKMISLCDSPSLAMASGVCKSWKDLISKDAELFRSFTMRGKGRNIIKGLVKHSWKCKLHSVKLEVTNRLGDDENLALYLNLEHSKDTLRSIEVFHRGDLGSMLWKLAQTCNRLSTLSSTLLDPVSDQESNRNLQNQVGMGVGPTWQAQLDKLVWIDDSSSLVFDDALLSHLRQAKVIELGKSCMVDQDWIINLFSSSAGQTLVKVKIPSIRPLEEDDDSVELPILQLPNLESLSLQRALLRHCGGYECTFFSNLRAPKLQALQMDELVAPDDLNHLKSENLRSLSVGLEGNGPYTGRKGRTAASEFVVEIADRITIQELHLKVAGEESGDFCNHVISLLTPVSKEIIDFEWKDQLLFPNLKKLRLESQVAVELFGLGCFVASRLAVSRRVSPENVLWATNGRFEASEEPPSESNMKFSSSDAQVCSVIESVDISKTKADPMAMIDGEVAFRWLKSSLREFNHPY